ncbi:MAG: hypothetical protein U1E53_05470 [Dongiaceae bacterium]
MAFPVPQVLVTISTSVLGPASSLLAHNRDRTVDPGQVAAVHLDPAAEPERVVGAIRAIASSKVSPDRI